MNIIGLGKAGCKIAETFKQHSQYTVFKFDADISLKRKKNCFYIPEQGSVEEYDANPISLKRLKDNLDDDDEVFFIVCGSGKVSGSALWILQHINHLKINIVYIRPDNSILDKKGKLRNKAHFHVLQEYARSGVFQKMYIIDNVNVSGIVGKTSVLQYYNKINELILNIIHMLNVYTNTESAFDNFQNDLVTTRIATFSMVDFESEEEKDFFFIEEVNQIKYFYGVNRITIENDETLLEKVNQISTAHADEYCLISYGIFSIEHEVGYCFAVKSTATIQEME